jgi:hypothetical protein
MDATHSNRRIDIDSFRYLDHAIDLSRSHGWRYAAAYLRNQRIAEPTLQRVLFGEWTSRRAPLHNLLLFRQGGASEPQATEVVWN